MRLVAKSLSASTSAAARPNMSRSHGSGGGMPANLSKRNRRRSTEPRRSRASAAAIMLPPRHTPHSTISPGTLASSICAIVRTSAATRSPSHRERFDLTPMQSNSEALTAGKSASGSACGPRPRTRSTTRRAALLTAVSIHAPPALTCLFVQIPLGERDLLYRFNHPFG